MTLKVFILRLRKLQNRYSDYSATSVIVENSIHSEIHSDKNISRGNQNDRKTARELRELANLFCYFHSVKGLTTSLMHTGTLYSSDSDPFSHAQAKTAIYVTSSLWQFFMRVKLIHTKKASEHNRPSIKITTACGIQSFRLKLYEITKHYTEHNPLMLLFKDVLNC